VARVATTDSYMHHRIYLKLTTQRSMNDVGGKQNIGKLGLAVAVTFSTIKCQYRVFDEAQVDELIDLLTGADLVVGHNHVEFDHQVLQGYTRRDMLFQTVNHDLLLDLEKRVGCKLSLNSLATATLGVGRVAKGMEKLAWWWNYQRTGDKAWLLRLAEGCALDVKTLMLVHWYGIEHGHVLFTDRSGIVRQVQVDWATMSAASRQTVQHRP